MNHAAEEEPVPASPQALARLDRFKADADLKGLYGLVNVFWHCFRRSMPNLLV
jgi:hypothetical protein